MTKLKDMDPATLQKLIDAAARTDFMTFAKLMFEEAGLGGELTSNWHLESIAYHLELVAKGECKRLLITVPPRSLKSVLCSVLFPAFMLGQDPSKKIICASYSDDLAKTFSRLCRHVVKHPRYKRLFPRTAISPFKDSEKEFETTKLGLRYATSVGATLTGRGGSLIIIDDPLMAQDGESKAARDKVERWLRETVLSRLDDKRNDAIILIMQRLHLEDPAGIVLEMGGWTHVNFPAIAEEAHHVQIGEESFFDRPEGHVLFAEREPREVLDRMKREMGSRAFSAQYQQAPVPPDGNLIKGSWFQCYGERFNIMPDDKFIVSCDTAMSGKEIGSYSVIMTCAVRKQTIHILDVKRARWEYPDLKRAVSAEHYRCHRITGKYELIIENKGSGISLIQDLNEDGIRARPIEPYGDKIVRVTQHSGRIEAGYVWLPSEALWLSDFMEEVLAFPHGKHDDQVDALSQVLERVFYQRPPRAYTYGIRGNV